jgi:quinolinate synthase
MAMNGLKNLIAALKAQQPRIEIDEATRVKAAGCITRMLDFTAALKLRSGMTPGIGAA